MYAAPRIYGDQGISEPDISMYKMKPIYDHLSDNLGSCSSELEARQEKCLGDLEMLMKRVKKLQKPVCNGGMDGSSEMNDLDARQAKCLRALDTLMNRVEKLQTECSGSKSGGSSQKLDLVIGCSVGSPAVYTAAIMARKVNCLIKVFSHSSNKKEVDSTITDKLHKINQNDSDYFGLNLIYKDVSAPYFMACPGRQIAVSGLGNILRYVSRQQGFTSLYNENQLEAAALVDEILSLVDSLEQRISGATSSDIGQLLNRIAGYLKSGPYLAGQGLTIADIALCSCLAAMDPNTIPNSLKAYLTNCVKAHYELKVLKAFLPDWGKQ